MQMWHLSSDFLAKKNWKENSEKIVNENLCVMRNRHIAPAPKRVIGRIITDLRTYTHFVIVINEKNCNRVSKNSKWMSSVHAMKLKYISIPVNGMCEFDHPLHIGDTEQQKDKEDPGIYD